MWAIDMIAEEPVIPVEERRYMCDGTYGGVPKEQVSSLYSKTVNSSKFTVMYA